jgi:hypothetical protein
MRLLNDGVSGKSGVLIALGMLAEHILVKSQDERAVAGGNWPDAGPAVLSCLGIGEDDVARLAAEFPEMQA